MGARLFIDFVGLAHIVVLFPTASVLVLHHRQAVARLGSLFWLAYWLIGALCFFEAWRLINWGDEDATFYRGKHWRRKLVAVAALVGAFVIADVLFPVAIEGYSWPGGVVVFMLILLGTATGAAGFVSTREHSIAKCGQADIEQATRVQNGSVRVLLAVGAALGGGALFPAMKPFYAEIFEDRFLAAGAIFLLISFFTTFAIYPWLIARSMESVNKEPLKATDE